MTPSALKTDIMALEVRLTWRFGSATLPHTTAFAAIVRRRSGVPRHHPRRAADHPSPVVRGADGPSPGRNMIPRSCKAGPVHRDLRRSSGDVTSQSVIGIGRAAPITTRISGTAH